MRQEITLSNDSGKPAKGVRILFVLKRAVVASCQLSGLPSGSQQPKINLLANGIEISWTPAIPPGATLVATIEVHGEPIAVARVFWMHDGAESQLVEQNYSIDQDTIRLHGMRGDWIKQIPDSTIKKYHSFFYDLDSNTHPKLIPTNDSIPPDEKTKRLKIIPPMAGLLSTRVLARAAWAAANKTPAQGLPSDQADAVQYISQLLLGIYRRHFPDSNNRIDAASAWSAFEMFTNGELRVRIAGTTWNSEPDSAYEFSFAEFAFMAIENEIDKEDWTALLPGLVATQRIFMAAYKPLLDPPYYYKDYKPENWSEDKKVTPETKDALQKEFSGRSVDELRIAAGVHANQAFPGGKERP